MMFVVKMRSFGLTKSLCSFDTEVEANAFCESYSWHMLDENCFEWDLDVEEA